MPCCRRPRSAAVALPGVVGDRSQLALRRANLLPSMNADGTFLLRIPSRSSCSFVAVLIHHVQVLPTRKNPEFRCLGVKTPKRWHPLSGLLIGKFHIPATSGLRR